MIQNFSARSLVANATLPAFAMRLVTAKSNFCYIAKGNRRQCPISRAVSMGRRNTRPKSACKGLNSQESFASVDSNGTPSWLGSDRVQPDKAVLHWQVLSDQLTKWCCIDRLSSH